MRIHKLLLSLIGAAAAAAAATTTTITLHIPPSNALPNPRALPPSTHATLTTASTHRRPVALLTPANTLVFRNVSAGSYLLDVHSGTHAFAPLRVDVVPVVAAGSDAVEGLRVAAWETYRGNDWDNKGEAIVVTNGALGVRVLGAKGFYMERSSFNIMSIFKNPMILLGLVSMGIFIGMPYLVDNMDPEMRKEWEESQKQNPMNSLMGGGQAGQNPMNNFDMAAFLAGSKKDSSSTPPPSNNNASGAGGAKKEKGGRK